MKQRVGLLISVGITLVAVGLVLWFAGLSDAGNNKPQSTVAAPHTSDAAERDGSAPLISQNEPAASKHEANSVKRPRSPAEAAFLTPLQLKIANDFAPFLTGKLYSSHKRQLCIDMLAEFYLSRARGDTGSEEMAMLENAIGPADFEELKTYWDRLPHVQLANQIEAHLRRSGVELGSNQQVLRALMERVDVSNPIYANRMAEGRELTTAEATVVANALWQDYADLRLQARERLGDNGAKALDAWIENSIAESIDFLRTAQAVASQGSRPAH